MTKQIITAETVRLAWKAGQSVIVYAEGDIVTQQAQDDARHYGVTLTTEALVVPESTVSAEPVAPTEPEAPAPSAREEQPVQEPQHVPTPSLTAEELATATRQLQEVLAPLTQALTASVKTTAQDVPAPVSDAPTSVTAQAITVVSAPAQAAPAACAPANTDDALLVAIRRGVLSALPAGIADENMIDRLIRSVLAEMSGGQACETRPGVRQAGGVTHVDSRAQHWNSSRVKGGVSVMDVLAPSKGDTAAVGYLDWENLSFSWTFRRTEVLVVLEGELNLSIEGTTFRAAHGDVFSIPAGTVAELSASGHVRCTTVAVAAQPRS